jgi:hypothetical protein
MKWQDPKAESAGTIFGMEIIVDASLRPGEIILVDSNKNKHLIDTSYESIEETAWNLL